MREAVPLSRTSYLSDMRERRRKSKLQRQLEESIKLARKGMLPQQLQAQDSLGRKLKDIDGPIRDSLQDPDELGIET